MAHSIQVPPAIAFVNQNGSNLEKVRLQALLGRMPGPQFLKPLLDLQNRDGGFPSRPRPGSPSSVDSTLTALWQLNDVGQRGSEPAARAREFLVRLQNEDGSWDENPDLPTHDLPPWIQPGDLATSLYLTAYAAFWLGLSVPGSPAFVRAAAFLAGEQDENGRIPSYLHANWIATSALLLAGQEQAQATQKGLGYLDSQPFDNWDASQIAWALDNLGAAGLPGDHPFVQRGLEELARRQSPDGSWASEDGPAYAASATVSALKVFQHFLGLPLDGENRD
jgi:squalene cyclase